MPTGRAHLYQGSEVYLLIFSRLFSRFDGRSGYSEGCYTAVCI
jgi:hypothetical protein